MLQVFVKLYQLAFISLEDIVHAMLLVPAKADALGKLIVVPPAAWGAEL